MYVCMYVHMYKLIFAKKRKKEIMVLSFVAFNMNTNGCGNFSVGKCRLIAMWLILFSWEKMALKRQADIQSY